MVPLSPIENALGASRGCKRPLDAYPACGKRPQTPIAMSPVLQPARLVCARQPGSPASRTRPADSSLVAIIGSNPCTCLPILLGSGVGAGFPGCSSPTSQSRRRRPRDAHARTRLKALWLAAKLRQAPPRQPAECAAVVSLLTRDLHQLRIPIAAAGIAPQVASHGALPSRACASEAARLPAHLETGVGTRLVPPAYAASRCRPDAGQVVLHRGVLVDA
jgi:hypothetical protein